MKEVKPAAMKIAQAARYLGIGESDLRDRTDKGEIPCFRLGRSRYFTVESLNKWLANLPKWVDDGQAEEGRQ